MKINYKKIFKRNLENILKEVLEIISKNGLSNNNHLYITFKTNIKGVEIPKWLKSQYSKEMTIIIQHEFWDLKVSKEKFSVILSFNNTKAFLSIPFHSVISFADPSANFGLKLSKKDTVSATNKIKGDVINLDEFRKN
ncbi:MAG: hypothetical protein CFH21_00622 [Alphaproteobacteria bacterium MarineAlpha5_Bin11]|nr:hypothetical protein [Pelagibacteraceae bacterium]PPR43888.1 MAG: hypothetical protein CFH21_00622 [Alphaproteobacteria bacterium MarineAlpha5_Bin11]PPR51627.1 MAG: hypothetical protein CFH20_00412 [Alphaproteobacteria bacterium MarineAlpha5_Bin10]|tara:strand:- start:19 stop:432 length:414 start_codon:yes stop_codon:yes gene_type:complete